MHTAPRANLDMLLEQCAFWICSWSVFDIEYYSTLFMLLEQLFLEHLLLEHNLRPKPHKSYRRAPDSAFQRLIKPCNLARDSRKWLCRGLVVLHSSKSMGVDMLLLFGGLEKKTFPQTQNQVLLMPFIQESLIFLHLCPPGGWTAYARKPWLNWFEWILQNRHTWRIPLIYTLRIILCSLKSYHTHLINYFKKPSVELKYMMNITPNSSFHYTLYENCSFVNKSRFTCIILTILW